MRNSLPWTPMNRRAKFDAVSSAEKSVTVQMHIKKQTTTHTQTNSNRYIHSLPIGMCVDNNISTNTERREGGFLGDS